MIPLLLQTGGPGTDWPEAIIVVGGISMVTIIIVVAIWQVFGTWRARMSVAREDAYRKLAEESLSAQTRTSVQQQRISDDLSSINERVASIEKLLKEVGWQGGNQCQPDFVITWVNFVTGCRFRTSSFVVQMRPGWARLKKAMGAGE